MDTEKFCPSFMEFRLYSYILLFSQSSSVINSLTFRRDWLPSHKKHHKPELQYQLKRSPITGYWMVPTIVIAKYFCRVLIAILMKSHWIMIIIVALLSVSTLRYSDFTFKAGRGICWIVSSWWHDMTVRNIVWTPSPAELFTLSSSNRERSEFWVSHFRNTRSDQKNVLWLIN